MKETQQNVEEAESKASVQIINHEQEICKWPTETFAIDHYHYREDEDDNPNSDPELEPTMIYPHTVLMFVPGNPGCAGWYISMLKTIIEKLGRGYSCRAVSYAGHGTLPHLVRGKRNHLDHESKNVNMNMNIAWSVDGQVEHKVQWVDMITREFVSRRRSSSNKRNSNIHSHSHSHRIPRYIFISHLLGRTSSNEYVFSERISYFKRKLSSISCRLFDSILPPNGKGSCYLLLVICPIFPYPC